MRQEIYTTMRDLEEVHWWFIARRAILKKILDAYAPPVENRRVLEVGCGSGGNLELLSHYGELHAMEIDDAAREFANKRNVCEVRKGSLPDNIPFDTQFDMICLFDVLEHIENDVGTLKALNRLLAPDGVIIVTVPAYDFLWCDHDTLHFHQRRYTRRQLSALARVAGLRVAYSSYFNCLLFPLIAGVRFFERLTNKKGSDMKMPARWINKLLKSIFSSERYLLPGLRYPFGVSLLEVLKKPRGSVPAPS